MLNIFRKNKQAPYVPNQNTILVHIVSNPNGTVSAHVNFAGEVFVSSYQLPGAPYIITTTERAEEVAQTLINEWGYNNRNMTINRYYVTKKEWDAYSKARYQHLLRIHRSN